MVGTQKDSTGTHMDGLPVYEAQLFLPRYNSAKVKFHLTQGFTQNRDGKPRTNWNCATRSGGLIFIDTGYLGIWSHDAAR